MTGTYQTLYRTKRTALRPAFVAALALVMLCIAGCGGSANPGGSATAMEKRTVSLVLQKDSSKEVEELQANLYFKGDGDVPYVAVSEFLPFFGSLYQNEALGNLALEFSFEDNDGVLWVTRADNSMQMLIDPKADTIGFVDYDAFVQSPGDTALVPLVTIGSTGYGGSMSLMKDAGSYNRHGLFTTFDLNKYGIDIVAENGETYVPLQTMHDIFLGHNYYFTVFNGEKVFVYAYGCDLSEQIQSVPTAQMSEAYAEFNYNELVFLLDSFYGLKPEHNIDSFYKFIPNMGLEQKLASTDPDEFDMGLAELTLRYLDDQHSGFFAHSHLSKARDQDPMEAEAALDEVTGTSKSTATKDLVLFKEHRAKYYPEFGDESFLYEEVGDTAFVAFDSFLVDKQDYYKEADLKNPQDTIELIAAAHKQIMRDGSPIKNVVLDLSCNDGGDADAAAFVIAWYGGSRQLGLRNTLTGAQSVVFYAADVNLDGKFDGDDTLYEKMQAGELNLYCLTSGNSFSCGNLVPAALKGSGVVLLGQTTGGGSCAVLPCTTASGASFRISGTSQISTIKNGAFYNVDTGIDPDVPITRFETFYDRPKLVDFIHALK